MLKIYLSLFLVFLMGCQTTNKKNNVVIKPHPKPPVGFVQEKLQQITTEGENRYPHLSPDHTKMLYVSSHRAKHLHSQVYLLDFQTKQDKRITFQDGQLMNPQFFPQSDEIIYESTTDEDKEYPQLLKKQRNLSSEFPNNAPSFQLIQPLITITNSELYLSDRGGNAIKRLTESPQFDGTSQVISPNEILFSAFNKNEIDLYKLTKNKKVWSKKLLKAQPHHQLQAQLHVSSQRLAWVEFEENFLHSNIVIANDKAEERQVLDMEVQYSFSPAWHPSGEYLLFTSNRDDIDNYELFVYDFSTKCIKRLTYLSTTELDPTFSPDGQYIYFSSNLQGSYQIYRMKFHPPLACPAPASTARL